MLVVCFLSFSVPLNAQVEEKKEDTSLFQWINPDGKGNSTFTPGVRLQVRYEFNEIDHNNDFFIRRLRFKGKGKIFDIATYNLEIKIDNTGRFNSTPLAQLEHAWFTIPLVDEILNLRVGLEDDVFSRNALTSDSKLLVMDRSLIKNYLTTLGITDNTVGVLAYGRPLDGRLSYSAGIFDNLGFETNGGDLNQLSRQSDGFMATGRVVYDFLDPANSKSSYDDYKGSYIGEGQRLSLGGNAAYQSDTQIANDKFDLLAWGFDIFYNSGPLVLEAEYDGYSQKYTTDGTLDFDGSGWYAQGGYLVFPKVELAVRYQELDANDQVIGDKLKWTTVGVNWYLRGHSFKMQADYTIKDEQLNKFDNNVFQVQLQLSF
jgi:phosphate-selective porin